MSIRYGTKIISGQTEIVDDLTSTSSNKALSANQGRVLKDEIDTVSIDKQDTLVAGTNISIASDGKTISAIVPTKTSDLTNDSDFITSSYHDSTKQNVISDLEEIRSGAEAGSTAIQPNDNVSSLTNDANYQTNTQVSSAISTHNSSSTAHNDIRTELTGKQTTITGGATTITSSNLTANRALVSNASGKVAVSDITSTELGYLDNVTSNIQTQLNAKVDKITTASKVYATNASGGQTSLSYDAFATGNTVALRGNDGTVDVSTPYANNHAANKSYVDTAVASKSTVSVSATGTATDEVKYITVNGVQKKIGGGSEEDNLSITKNASGKIQTVGVIDDNDNSTAIKTWTGTFVEYNSITTKDADTLYNVTDDISGGMSIYTKTEVDTLLSTKANDSNVVHKTGNERIVGNKTFVSRISHKDELHAQGTYESDIWGADNCNFIDADGNRIARVQTKFITGTNINEVGMYATVDGVAEQGIRVRSNGYTYAPTPATSSNNNNIATTAYVVNILKALYPVGSLYIGTQSTNPMTTLIPGSSWSLVATNRALWGGDGTNANTTIEAGLPNITGELSGADLKDPSGVFSANGTTGSWAYGSSPTTRNEVSFSARNSNTIYDNSTTVQPPAYRVNVWRRTA